MISDILIFYIWTLMIYDVICCLMVSSVDICCHLMTSDDIWCHLMSSEVIWCHLMSSVVMRCHLLASVVICCHLLSSVVTIARSYYFETFWKLTHSPWGGIEGPHPWFKKKLCYLIRHEKSSYFSLETFKRCVLYPYLCLEYSKIWKHSYLGNTL